MYDYFLQRSSQQFGQLHFPEFNYLQTSYQRQLETIEAYYKTRVFTVKSNHFLATLLNHLSVPMQYEIGQYVNAALVRAPYLANAMKLTHALSPGQLFNGVFYGEGCSELILSDDSYFDPITAERNWETLKPVRVLLHPKSDLGLLIPNGKITSSEQGLAVISINIPLLAVQYRGFALSQFRKMEQSQSLLGLSHFIAMYVIPGMVGQQTDLSIMNRLSNLFYGAPMGEAQRKHPFVVFDYQDKIDKVLKKVLETLSSRSLYSEQWLRTLPTISNSDGQAMLMLPDLAPTRQVHWALVLSRLPILSLMLDVMGEDGIRRNRMDLNNLQKVLKRLQREQIYSAVLNADLSYDTQLTIDRIMGL